jgi:hypothetical protein
MDRGACLALLAVLGAQLALASAGSFIPRQPVEITPSISLYFVNDVKLTTTAAGKTSRCQEMLERASKFSARQIHLVITHYWFNVDGTNKTAGNYYWCAPTRAMRGLGSRPPCGAGRRATAAASVPTLRSARSAT